MQAQTNVINALTAKLPYALANQIFKEFQDRLSESMRLINGYKKYQPLEQDTKALEMLLALSIFYKRVVVSLDAGVKFHKAVTSKSQADTIVMGSYSLTPEEKNKILGVVISYKKLIAKFSIHPDIMEYNETREFLTKLIQLKSTF